MHKQEARDSRPVFLSACPGVQQLLHCFEQPERVKTQKSAVVAIIKLDDAFVVSINMHAHSGGSAYDFSVFDFWQRCKCCDFSLRGLLATLQSYS
jgi:hypothetical protein